MGTTITRKTDYASRIVLELAMAPPGVWVTTQEIADRRLVPHPITRQVVSQLVKSGLVKSRRGSEGGVSLARPAAEISLLDVVEAMEGPIALNPCVLDPQECPLVEECPVHDAWVRAQADLVAHLRQETFDVLAQRALAERAAHPNGNG
ncbi:MAG: Rrf2 family transcriptional regulator [Anaerolineae bacterium]|nr:Rrf2 family transcriptional regulator [Anaerolineae bacterium]